MSFSFLPSSPCQPDEIHFELSLLTDGRGDEVAWALRETYSSSIALSGSGYENFAQHNVIECLPAKCYTFVINDTGHDGLCCDYGSGGYSVRLNGLKVASGSAYESKDENVLQCMIPPTSSPTLAPAKVCCEQSPTFLSLYFHVSNRMHGQTANESPIRDAFFHSELAAILHANWVL